MFMFNVWVSTHIELFKLVFMIKSTIVRLQNHWIHTNLISEFSHLKGLYKNLTRSRNFSILKFQVGAFTQEGGFSNFNASAIDCNICTMGKIYEGAFIFFDTSHLLYLWPLPDNPDKNNHPLCPSSPRPGVKTQRVTNGLVPTTKSLGEQFI